MSKQYHKTFEGKRKYRSANYQWRILEVPVDFNDFINLGANDGLYPISDIAQEGMHTLDQQAFQRLSYLISTQLTALQQGVFQGLREGKTQMEIALVVLPHQSNSSNSNVCKIIQGNQDYKTGRHYGGLRHRIPQVCLVDETYRLLIKQLEAYQSEEEEPIKSVMYFVTRSWFQEEIDFLDWLDTPLHLEAKLALWQIEILEKTVLQFFQTSRQLPPNLSYGRGVKIKKLIDEPSIRKIQDAYQVLYPQLKKQHALLTKTFFKKRVSKINKLSPADIAEINDTNNKRRFLQNKFKISSGTIYRIRKMSKAINKTD